MNVTIELMAQLRDAAGAATLQLSVPDDATTHDALRALGERSAALRDLLFDAAGALQPTLLVACAGKQVPRDEPASLAPDSVLVVASPVAGG